FLVLTDAYYPGWTATVNGQPAQVEKADGMFRAVAVPAGVSTVVFEYHPGWWPGILIAGGAAWLLVLVALVVLRRR
ncbi:MAG: YfhO family protein, partial [Anaerolineae bacterium]|nr:YfhO family protein [Anaerolineae bacterium]